MKLDPIEFAQQNCKDFLDRANNEIIIFCSDGISYNLPFAVEVNYYDYRIFYSKNRGFLVFQKDEISSVKTKIREAEETNKEKTDFQIKEIEELNNILSYISIQRNALLTQR